MTRFRNWLAYHLALMILGGFGIACSLVGLFVKGQPIAGFYLLLSAWMFIIGAGRTDIGPKLRF